MTPLEAVITVIVTVITVTAPLLFAARKLGKKSEVRSEASVDKIGELEGMIMKRFDTLHSSIHLNGSMIVHVSDKLDKHLDDHNHGRLSSRI